jgi:tetraacyldisaccharide 4'-kinase
VPYRARLPVICVGNLTAGGTGKTPLSLAIAESLLVAGEHPVFLTRGYRGRLAGPLWVDRKAHTARDVGDEPLLLARSAPAVVARDRKAGAALIERSGQPASVIIMDDGLQNPALAKDLSIAVVDGARGVGNGEVIPAGPLRAPLELQLSRVDCIVVNGGEEGPFGARLRREFPGPVLSAAIAPADGSEWLTGARVVAYAGIGNPGRFFATLEALGAEVVARVPFPDHHTFGGQNAARLLALARERSAELVTTEKDLVRLHGAQGRLAELRLHSRALGIRIDLTEGDQVRLMSLIEGATRRLG